MKFGIMTHIGTPTADQPLKFEFLKMQDGGGHHLENRKIASVTE